MPARTGSASIRLVGLVEAHLEAAEPDDEARPARGRGSVSAMGRLIFSMSVSLDGFVDTPAHSLDWVRVDDELHTAFNEGSRAIGTSLYGRRMYELMAGYWPTADKDPEATPVEVEFALIWQATPKVVFSRTLDEVAHGARLVRDDAVAEVARLKAGADYDMDVGGPTLAGSLIAAGLVDEYRLYVHPVILGGGTRVLPRARAAGGPGAPRDADVRLRRGAPQLPGRVATRRAGQSTPVNRPGRSRRGAPRRSTGDRRARCCACRPPR